MSQFPLAQGAYTARNAIANAQVCYNLYPEPNPKDAPFPLTHYCSPGTYLFQDLSSYGAPIRGLYTSSDGNLWVCAGTVILKITPNPISIVTAGNLPNNSGQPVSMCDNGTTLVIVDGTSGGWQAPLSGGSLSMTAIDDPAFYGSNYVDFIDTFLVFNWPGTPTFYTTTSNVVEPFNPLYFAEKVGWNDRLVAARVLHDNIWLLGNVTTEVWYNSGASTFPFQRMPNTVIQQGCAAIYSVVITDNAIYWVSQDRWGHSMLMRGEGYTAKRVSNFAVENEWRSYGAGVASAVGMSFQVGGHEFIGLRFPGVNVYWVYDASTGLWHKRTAGNTTNIWPIYCAAYWGNVQGVETTQDLVLGGDAATGQLWVIDEGTYTDNGVAIQRTRSWPHIVNDGKRVVHSRFSAALDPSGIVPDGVSLSWSDDGGQTFNPAVTQVATPSSATYGQYQWRRLGYARDRVYKLQWTGAGNTALNGAWVDTVPSTT